MDLVVAVAIGVLSVIFGGSLLALIIICRSRFCNRDRESKPILKYSKESKLEDGNSELGTSNSYELDDVLQLGPNIERILRDNDWEHDTSGLAPHCLAILKGCHLITDRLSGLSFRTLHRDQELLSDVCSATRRITPQVNDLVKSMYPPLDLQAKILLEARASALVLAVHNLSLIFKGAIASLRTSDWLASALNEMDSHLQAVHDAVQMEQSGYNVKVVISNGPATSSGSVAVPVPASPGPSTSAAAPSSAQNTSAAAALQAADDSWPGVEPTTERT